MSQTGQLDAGQGEALPPAKLVRDIFGLEGAAAIGGVSTFAVLKWARTRRTGGGGGLIPPQHQRKYLLAAQRLGKALTAEQLIAAPY